MEKVLREIKAIDNRLESKVNAFGHRLSTLQGLLWGVIVALIGLAITLIFKH